MLRWFSIGSNDLTQLTLGVDRDSEILAAEFDERDPGVLKIMAMAVQGARQNGRHSGSVDRHLVTIPKSQNSW